jgi:hypothetical protein
MVGLGDDRNAERLDFLSERIRDLIRQPLLHLQPSRKDVD